MIHSSDIISIFDKYYSGDIILIYDALSSFGYRKANNTDFVLTALVPQTQEPTYDSAGNMTADTRGYVLGS